jgi:DNA-binding NarL/FixJ family response regulator
VTLLDTSRTFADALSARLSEEPDLTVSQVQTVADAVHSLRAHHTDVAVVAADLAGEVLTRAGEGRRWTGPPYVVVLAQESDDRVTSLVCAGAAGWVRRSESARTLIDTLRRVQNGQTVIPPDLLTELVDDLVSARHQAAQRDGPLGGLTARELQVLRLLQQGLSRQQIADSLNLSPNTVRTHVQKVRTRLGVHSTVAAVAVCRNAGPGPGIS